MCGIAGFAGAGTATALANMGAALRHRGPDGHGAYVDPRYRVGLGHQRLAVIDPDGGHQPMWNEDRTVAVVFNGEIYNAAELRAELNARGHRFASDHSDTEVLVHGFEQWQDALPERLNGMFAFAVYDVRRGRLFFARDRFGEKPLYYTQQGDVFAFASELKALRGHPALEFELDPTSIQKLFAYGFIPAPRSAFRHVQKLRAGWTLSYDCRTRGLVTRPFWTFRLEGDPRLEEAREETLVEELRALLSQSVRRRLVSDVPLGIFLSGGIDSATVLACAARHRPADQLSTFTVGFEEASYDESDAAAHVAQHFGASHHATRLSLESAYSLIDTLAEQLDEPIGDPSLLPTYLLCRFARESVTVALSGDGGDELFAGYDPFLAITPATVYTRAVPPAVHALLRRAAERLSQMATALAICAAPLLLLLVSTEWFLQTINGIDAWHYVGFFQFYGNPEYSRGAYKLARLPWILAGWLVNRALPDSIAAPLVLHAIFLLAATTGMFVLAWRLFSSYHVALIGALILGFYPVWHGSGGWDYHNTAAARHRRPGRDAVAGAAAALAIHANITYGCFLPILVLHYIVVARTKEGRWPAVSRILMTAVCGTAGAVAITAALSAINVAVGREALFFKVLLDITLRYTADTTNLAAWWHPWSSGWFWVSYHLALPTAVMFLSPLGWWATRNQPPDTRALQRLAIGEFLIMMFVWSAWQFAGNLTLDWDYFFFPVVPHVLLALVAMLSTVARRVHRAEVTLVGVCLIGALGGGLATVLIASEPDTPGTLPVVAPLVLFVIAGMLAVIPWRWSVAAFAVIFGAANALSARTPDAYSAWGRCHISADTYRLIVGSAKFVTTIEC